MYITGTIQTDRVGYAKKVVTAKRYQTVNKRKFMVPPQGTIKLAQNKLFLQITAVVWMDRNLVHKLSSGGSRQIGTVMRRIQGEIQPLPAPELVRDYHRWMGGVDVNDQLRMQRYSVQLCFKTRKYYKTLFFGLLDMAFVNAFIVFRYDKKVKNKRPAKHFAFFEELIEQLLAVDSIEIFCEIEQATTARDRTAPSPSRSEAREASSELAVDVEEGHHLENNPDTVDGEQGVKRHHRSRKVCALFKVKPRKFTKYFCPECSTGNRRKYLCNVCSTRRKRENMLPIWHTDWGNGNDIPRLLLLDHEVRDRPPPSRPNKKRRCSGQPRICITRNESEANEEEADEEEAGGDDAGNVGGGEEDETADRDGAGEEEDSEEDVNAEKRREGGNVSFELLSLDYVAFFCIHSDAGRVQRCRNEAPK